MGIEVELRWARGGTSEERESLASQPHSPRLGPH